MNRTLERIVFMLIGATLAFLGYLVGDTTPPVNAQTAKRYIECDELVVKKAMLIGNTQNSILLTVANGNPTIQMYCGVVDGDFSTAKSRILLGVTPDVSTFGMQTADSSEFGITAGVKQVTVISSYGRDTPSERSISLMNMPEKRPSVFILDKLGEKRFP